MICLSTRLNCIISCIYRPPNTDKLSFLNLLNFINNFINTHNQLDKRQVFIFGDFNFPKLNWKDDNILEFDTPSAVDLSKFINQHLFSQYIKENTRQNNILDLFFTNDINFVQFVKVNDINISDHNLVEIYTSFFPYLSTDNVYYSPMQCEQDFSKFNFNSSNFEEINLEFSRINWQREFSVPLEDIPKIFNDIVYSVLEKHLKSFHNKNHKKKEYFFKKSQYNYKKIRQG